ncbi:MAG: SRPBCC family protein [Candidatus Thiodiazotropha sp.]
MQVVNIHESELTASAPTVGVVIDNLATQKDVFWPRDQWPAMYFDRPLAVGAIGGHGPIRYIVDAYQPGRMARFRFTDMPGFNGHHWLEVLPGPTQGSILRHTIQMEVTGWARLYWLLIVRYLHDALLEDALYQAQIAMGIPATQRPWSLWVKFLRRMRYKQPANHTTSRLEKES